MPHGIWREVEMAGAPRDRVTIDLRGIGDAVRAAGARRGMGVAQHVRRAVVMSFDLRATGPVAAGSDGQTPGQTTAKLTLRLAQAHADALILNAGAVGLSYGGSVARLVDSSRLPQPLAERQADRAALLESNDPIATLSTDLVALVTLLRQSKVEQARPYRDRRETADLEIRRHLDRVLALIDRLRGRTAMPSSIDGLLVQWGDRPFCPSYRMTSTRASDRFRRTRDQPDASASAWGMPSMCSDAEYRMLCARWPLGP